MKRGAEFSVYQGGSPARRPPPTLQPPLQPPLPLPDNLNLRLKQRSLTNLTLLGDGEQRAYSLELTHPQNPGAGAHRPGGSVGGSPRKERGSATRGARARSLSLSLTKVLSQSEHSLIPVPWRCTQRASYGGHPRVEPPRAPRQDQEGDGRDREGSDSGKPQSRERDGEYWAEEEVSGGGPREGTAQLDQEVILTMLGDLEQVLHTRPRPRKSGSLAAATRSKDGKLQQNMVSVLFVCFMLLVQMLTICVYLVMPPAHRVQYVGVAHPVPIVKKFLGSGMMQPHRCLFL